MIVNETDAKLLCCPIVSDLNFGWDTCQGSSCMAWRPYRDGYGMCGLCNPTRDHGTPDEIKIKKNIPLQTNPPL